MKRIEVHCGTCNKPVEKFATGLNMFRQTLEIDAWCHGAHAELDIGHSAMSLLDTPVLVLHAFQRPVRLITDRDPGDEDPNETWEEQPCQA